MNYKTVIEEILTTYADKYISDLLTSQGIEFSMVWPGIIKSWIKKNRDDIEFRIPIKIVRHIPTYTGYRIIVHGFMSEFGVIHFSVIKDETDSRTIWSESETVRSALDIDKIDLDSQKGGE